MEQKKIIPFYFDLNNHAQNQTCYFFLEHLLKARADLNLESGHHEFDQEINVYLSGLLNSIVASSSILQQKPYISAFDVDIRTWLDQHPGTRNEYVVYRDNAEFGLILLGLFIGYEHKGSYQHLVMPDADEKGRIALYYEFAASALQHLKGNAESLVNVFYAIAETMPEILQIIRRAAGTYFDLMARLSEGTMYHIEKDLCESERQKQYRILLDEFLKWYSIYRDNPTEEAKKNVLTFANRLKELNASFSFNLSTQQHNSNNMKDAT